MAAGPSLLLWADLRRGWPRTLLTSMAIAVGILGVGFFAGQADRQQGELLATYRSQGAASFVVELTDVGPGEATSLSSELGGVDGVDSVQALVDGLREPVVADTYFLVFHTGKRQEYLGARTSVLGVGSDFRFGTDYYVNFHDLSPTAPDAALPVPLLVRGGAGPPGPGEILVDQTIADYVGVRSGDRATIDLVDTGAHPPIVATYTDLRLSGTFQTIGPDEGRIDPFYRLVVRGKQLLTVRRVGAPATPTTIPVVVSEALISDFQAYTRGVLAHRGLTSPPPGGSRLVVHAVSVTQVPRVERKVSAVLEASGLGSSGSGRRSFRILIPERSNFVAALHQRAKVAAGGRFFIGTLLLLLMVGTAGLQVQETLSHWRQHGILRTLGFTRLAIARVQLARLGLVLVAAALIAAATAPVLTGIPGSALLLASGSCVMAALLGSVPAVLWPLLVPPAEALRAGA